jgi:regulator of replication initiation timing
MTEEIKKKERPRDPIYIVVIILLMIGFGVMLAQYMNLRGELEKCSTTSEKLTEDLDGAAEMLGSDAESFKEDLQRMLTEYDDLIASNAELGSENKALLDSLTANREKVAKLLQSAKNNKHLQYELFKYKKEAETLRNIMKGYVHTIDSLMIENSNLRFDLGERTKELTDAHTTIDDYKEKTTKLEQTVEAGKTLKCMNLNAVALRVGSGGDQKETERAKRANMFKACFMLLENPMAKAGPKNIYMRVLTPGGTVIDEGSIQTFKVGGNEIQYSASREVDYQNADVDLCIYVKLNKEINKGTYVVEIFADGARIGQTTVDLK